jgi:hypothetical protein
MIINRIRQIARTLALMVPPLRRLHETANNLSERVQQSEQLVAALRQRLRESESLNALIPELKQQMESARAKLLESESRNALIPGLQEQAASLQRRLLESESLNALIPELKQQMESARAKLLESESRNALIPGLQEQTASLQRRLLESESLNALIPELKQQMESARAKLLESESRNALIPGLQEQTASLQRRLLESESLNALIPELKQQMESARAKLLESESRNALIPGLQEQTEALRLRLLESESHNGLIPGLENRIVECQIALTAANDRVSQIPELMQRGDDLQFRLQDAESRNRIVVVRMEAELTSMRKRVSELELAQLTAEVRLGEIATAEERLGSLHLDQAASAESTLRHGTPDKCGKLRIAIFGNINNYPLMLAEGFRELGHEVRLVVNRKEALHRPEAKHPEWANAYPDWILDCSALSEESIMSYSPPLLSKIVSYFFDNADLVVLNDYGATLARFLPQPQMAFLTGSDLTYYANYQSLDLRTAAWDHQFKKSAKGRRTIQRYSDFVTLQRDGILAANLVSFGLRGLIPKGDELLDSIGVSDFNRMMVLLSDTLNLNPCPPQNNTKLRIFNGARVAWQQSADNRFSEQDLKGTDVLLNGFAIYCREGGKGELRMVRKGNDVESAIELCERLEIDGRVVWINEMKLHQFNDEVKGADLVCDQFGNSFPGMVTTHAYALGRPVLANLRNECFGKSLAKPLPGFQASTATEVAEHLLRLEVDRKAICTMGKRSRQYAEQHMSPTSMAEQVLAHVGLTRKE